MYQNLWENAIVVFANYHQATIGKNFRYNRVQSRFLVWCVSGEGKLEVNGKKFRMSPGTLLFVPWNHSIAYLGNPEKPFRLGCIHIIPDLPDDPVFFGAFHQATPECDEYHLRHDEFLPGFEEIGEFHLPLDHSLLRLGAYVIDRYQKNCPPFLLRLLPRLLLFELYEVHHKRATHGRSSYPIALQKMLDVIEHYLEAEINITMFVNNSGLSQAGVYRIFRRYFAAPPGEIIARRRLDHAANLLRNTNLTVGEISRRLQYRDPFYFSKCFKRRFHLAPRDYRNSDLVPPPDNYGVQHGEINYPSRKHYLYLPDRELR